MNRTTIALALGLAATSASAQSLSIITSPDAVIVLRNNAAPKALGFIDDQESIITTPSSTTTYDARPFWTLTGVNAMHGDADGDGDLADPEPLGDLNCMFVRRRPPHAETGPLDPGDIWISQDFTSTTFVATTGGIVPTVDGDVYRARNGVVEFFITEPVLSNAFNGGNFDIDALAQDPQGNLYLSVLVTFTVGTTTYSDGEIIMIPAAAITYDPNGLVTAVAAGSAQVVATEADVSAMASASGAINLNGAVITSIFDISGLEIDPNGGTWVSPVNAATLPNLLFCSNTTSHFDNIWTTAGGGQLAVINGVTIGYTSGFADGTALGIGLLPSGQDAISGLVVLPEQHYWIAQDCPQAGLPVGGMFDVEVGRCAPGSLFALFVSTWNNEMPGGWLVGLPHGLPSLGGNTLIELDLLTVTPLANLIADPNGYAGLTLVAPTMVPPGIDLLLQGIGTPFGSTGFALSATGNLTF